jgi:hypothetical protein
MSSLSKMFIFSFLIGLAFVGAGLSIDLSKMDNASKEYSQVIYFISLSVLAFLGHLALLIENAGNSKRSVNLLDFSIAVLSVTTGAYGFFRFKEAHFSYFTVVCLFILVIGVVGIVRATLLARKTIV